MIESWKEKFSYDKAAVERIDNYLKMHTVAMEITNFQNTAMAEKEGRTRKTFSVQNPLTCIFMTHSPTLTSISTEMCYSVMKYL